MKLSSKTLAVFKNFAQINQGILIREGSKLRTVAVEKNIFAEVEIPDTFEQMFAIYDLNELLSAYSLMGSPDLEFTDTHIQMINNNNKIKYYYSNPAVVVSPADKDITFPDSDVDFVLTAEDFSKLIKAASILKVDSVKFDKSGITLANSNSVGNAFTIEKEMTSSKSNFNFSIAVSRLKLISDLDYEVSISEKGISRFISKDFQLSYYISLDSN